MSEIVRLDECQRRFDGRVDFHAQRVSDPADAQLADTVDARTRVTAASRSVRRWCRSHCSRTRRGVQMLWSLCNAELDVATRAAVASCRLTVASSTCPSRASPAWSKASGRPAHDGDRRPVGACPSTPASYQAEGPRLTPRALWLVAGQLRGDLGSRRAGAPGSRWRRLGLAAVELLTILRSRGVHLLIGNMSFG